MYPTEFSHIVALIAALVPLVLWSLAAVQSALTKKAENKANQWRRIHDLSSILYNKDFDSGLWRQIVAIHELSTMRGVHREVAQIILESAKQSWSENAEMEHHLKNAIEKIRKKKFSEYLV